jgi:hypothetical protein
MTENQELRVIGSATGEGRISILNDGSYQWSITMRTTDDNLMVISKSNNFREGIADWLKQAKTYKTKEENE